MPRSGLQSAMAARGSWGKSVLPVLVAIVTAVAAAPAPVTGDQVAKLLSGQRRSARRR